MMYTCNLVRELEKLGKLQRYGHKHLKLWTDLIVEGKNGGVGEEPVWEEHIEVVGVPPKRRSLDEKRTSKPDQKLDNDALMRNLLIQNTNMMAMMSNMCMMQQVTNLIGYILVNINNFHLLIMISHYFTGKAICIPTSTSATATTTGSATGSA